jgi:hypothetical protein
LYKQLLKNVGAKMISATELNTVIGRAPMDDRPGINPVVVIVRAA